MNKRISAAAISTALCFTVIPKVGYAQVSNENVCQGSGYAVDYFNGVLTTSDEADVNLQYIKRTFGTTAPNGEGIRYAVFYNTSTKVQGSLTSFGYNDLLETFAQRLGEQPTVVANRFELFFEALNGGGPLSTSILTALPAYVNIFSSIKETFQATVIAAITSASVSPRTFADYATHRGQFDQDVAEGKKVILFPHSQGNLFANKAYTYALTKVPSTAVKVVHVAPASPTVNGPYALADKDQVINVWLRVAGTVQPANTAMPEADLRPASPISANDPPRFGKDAQGHGLAEIYLNSAFLALSNGVPSPLAKIKSDVNAAFMSLVAPPQQVQPGFFTATLTWDGPGDVDLHVYEPNSSHVYYSALRGTTGYLDLDNTTGNGPEHYYASCQAASLQIGTYRVAINNFSRATGRTANVIIASSKGGTLTSRSIGVGSERGSSGNQSPTPVVNVVVAKDQQTGIFSVSVN